MNARRQWIKLYVSEWLRGSIREEAVEIRGIFADLLALAGDSAYGEIGIIKLANGIGLADQTIAGILNIPPAIWLAAKERLSNHPDPRENRIELLPLPQGYAIKIINWRRYQSEYARQKPYRKAKKRVSAAPSSEKKIEEEDREGDRDDLSVTQVTRKVTSKVTSGVTGSLPPIPKNASFETIKELEDLRRQIFDEEKRPNSGRLQNLKDRYLKLIGIYET